MSTKEKRYFKVISCNLFFINALDKIGLKNTYTGYYYLIEIINLIVNENIQASSFYKNIYPSVAVKFNKTSCTIERNIRILIDNCWTEDLKSILNCKYMYKKPTCCQFINLIKNYILKLLK